jgi:hypothetical protein
MASEHQKQPDPNMTTAGLVFIRGDLSLEMTGAEDADSARSEEKDNKESVLNIISILFFKWRVLLATLRSQRKLFSLRSTSCQNLLFAALTEQRPPFNFGGQVRRYNAEG